MNRSLIFVAALSAAAASAAAQSLTARPSGAVGSTDTKGDTAKVIRLAREVFQYSSSGRRDPFVSLLMSTDIRPVFADLRLTTVAYDAGGHNSVAILRDLGTKEQYRVRVGSPLGRMRVVRIDPTTVTFAIEEFGFSRQQTLTMSDSTSTRTP